MVMTGLAGKTSSCVSGVMEGKGWVEVLRKAKVTSVVTNGISKREGR